MLKKTLTFTIIATLCLSSPIGLTGCAFQKPKKKVIKECVLPEDQKGTLSGRWKVTAIPIAVHQGDFDSDELKVITSAADTWNKFYAASLGMAAIDYGDASNPRVSSASKPSSLCYQGIVSGGSFSGSVVIYKQGAWPYSNIPDAMAITNFCTVAAKPLPSMYMAVLELNYQNFFVQGRRQPDLQTILIHEFGHMMGLNHSCEKTTTKAGMPNCTSSTLDPEYKEAIMYPVFGFDSYGNGEEKHSLNDNDQGRANCLYSDGVTQN